jgi:hypothetical protein
MVDDDDLESKRLLNGVAEGLYSHLDIHLDRACSFPHPLVGRCLLPVTQAGSSFHQVGR